MNHAAGISSVKRHGRHYTPSALADFLAKHTIAHAPTDKPSLTIIDPACGDAELLISIARAANSAGYQGDLDLIGYEIDAGAADSANRRLQDAGIRAQIIHDDFLVLQRRLAAGSADVIITNPPYVRTQNLGQRTAQLLANEFSLTGRVDLTHPFVTAASRLLVERGVMGLLCSNRFLTTLAGQNIRRTLTKEDLKIFEVYDLGDTKLFKAAVLPAIIIASKSETINSAPRFVSAYEAPVPFNSSGRPLFDALEATSRCIASHNNKSYEVRVGTLSVPADTKTPWRLSDPFTDHWLQSVDEKSWKRFGDIAKIRVGIKTTADNVFLGEDWSTRAPAVESSLLLPLITQRNITPWRISGRLDTKVLYPYDLSSERRRVLNIEDWPGASAYLRRHEGQLRGRKYVIEGGREWYEIWVPQRPALWAKPKIVFPDISESPRFALDTSGAVVNGNCYWISLADVQEESHAYLILAVANSSFGLRYYDEVCGNRLYSGKRRWITQYVKRLPLPRPDTAEARSLVAFARRLSTSMSITPDLLMRLDEKVEAAFDASQARSAPGEDREEFSTTLF